MLIFNLLQLRSRYHIQVPWNPRINSELDSGPRPGNTVGPLLYSTITIVSEYKSFHLFFQPPPVQATPLGVSEQVVGIALNGVPFIHHEGGKLSAVFDGCGG